MVQTFPGVGNLVDALCEGGFAQMARGRSGGGGGSATASPDTPPPIASFSSSLAAPPLRDSLSNQLDRLDAEMVSLRFLLGFIYNLLLFNKNYVNIKIIDNI
jgi:hypothetical protein